MIFSKEMLGYLSILLTLLCIAPYYYSIAIGKTRPHAFSWLIWGLLAAIGYAAQASTGAGPGAWGTGAGALACFITTLLGFTHGERNITKSDWIALMAALSAIPCWMVTSDALTAVILISVIDLIAYYPTFRKSWLRPHQEGISVHAIGVLKYLASLAAIEQWSLVTWLYPAVIATTSTMLTLMLVIRRSQLAEAV